MKLVQPGWLLEPDAAELRPGNTGNTVVLRQTLIHEAIVGAEHVEDVAVLAVPVTVRKALPLPQIQSMARP